MNVLNRDYSNNYISNSNTDKLFYRYNILYGSHSSNMIRTYSPKLRPKSASVSQYIKSMNKPNMINECVFDIDDIMVLFQNKCLDLQVKPKTELFQRFRDFVSKKCVNRVIDLSECNLGINSVYALCDCLVNKYDVFSRLNLMRNNIGDKGIETLVKVIEGNRNIVHLDLASNDIGIKGGMILLKMLINHTSLISVNLCSLDGINRNRISSEGVKLIEQVLINNQYLEFLNLSGNSIKNEGLKYLVLGFNENETLKYLDISKNEIDEKGTEYMYTLLKSSKLTTLNINGNHFKNEGLIHLATCLSKESLGSVTTLNVSDCKLNFEGLKSFFNIVTYNQRLNTLYLNNNNFCSKGFEDLESLIAPMNLRKITLSNCNISKYANGIALLLSDNSTLNHIDLSSNRIDDRTFQSFVYLPKDNHSLKSIDLSKNFISDSSGKEFILNLITNTSLHTINFYDNQLQNETANVILSVLQVNKSLLHLNVECNRIQLKMVNEIANALKANNDLQKMKYLPQLKLSIKTLQVHPKEMDEAKAKIKSQYQERELLSIKIEEDLKTYSREKEKLTFSINELELTSQTLSSQLEMANKNIADLLHEKNECNNESKRRERKIKDRMEQIEDDIHKIEKNMKELQDKITQTKEEHDREIFNTKLNLQAQKDKVRLGEATCNKEKELLEKKKNDFESGNITERERDSKRKGRKNSLTNNSSFINNKTKTMSKMTEQDSGTNDSSRMVTKSKKQINRSNSLMKEVPTKKLKKSSSSVNLKEDDSKKLLKKKKKEKQNGKNLNKSAIVVPPIEIKKVD